jgi:ferredoxin-NADP reductase
MEGAVARSLWARARDAASIVATPLAPSHYFELVSPLAATHVRYARVESIVLETPRARTLWLRPGWGWQLHRPGQFVPVGVEIDGRILTRTYSISSTPTRMRGRVAITVAEIDGGRVSSALVRRTAPGDYLRIGLPQGVFTMPDVPPERVLFVTAGSGITPVMSMLRTFAARGRIPSVVHLHFAPTARDVIFGAEIARTAAKFPAYHPVVVTTREGARRGRLTNALLDAIAPDWAERDAWACGPSGLLDAASALVRPGLLRVERFRTRLASPASDATGGSVRFGRSKKDIEVGPNTPLLEAAERAGVDAPHGCRLGICHSCDATLVSGCVRDLRSGARIDEPGARIQPCVSAAAGHVELDL